MKRIRVIGLGNVLMSDDALGPTVILNLKSKYNFPDNVELMELGTPGFDLLPYISECDYLIVIDTVRANNAPGTVKTYTRGELSVIPKDRVSPHEPTLFDALNKCYLKGDGPDQMILVGVVPSDCKSGLQLTNPVAEAVPKAMSKVISELENIGCKIGLKSNPLKVNSWWTN